MLTDSFRILEFDKIRAMLKNCATSNFGKELAEKILPSDEVATVQENLSLTTEAVKVFAVAEPPFGGIRDVRETLKKFIKDCDKCLQIHLEFWNLIKYGQC
ncbi:MAG: hypothetical protein IJT73_03350 [Selenomonadaceae bacterium]|nr:hypothetical protein [Selenomonadaceae bacterium]